MPPSLLLCLIAVPLAVLLPPTAHPAVLPVLLLLLAPALLHAARRGVRPCPWTALLVAGGLLLTWVFASYRHATAAVLLAALAYGAAWTAGRRLGPRGTRTLHWVLVATGSAAAAHGLYQVLWGLDRGLAEARVAGVSPEVLQRLASGRAFAAFPLPSQLGAFLLLCLPLTVLTAMELRAGGPGEGGGPSRRTRWTRRTLALGLVGLAVLQAGGLVATLSLGIFLGAGIGAAFLAFRRLSGRALLAAALVLLALGAGGAGLALGLRPELGDPTEHHNPVWMRVANWGVALEMLRDHPLAGVGPGCFGVRYPQYMGEGMNETRYAHNVPLQLAAEAGVWVLLPLLLGAWGLARRARGCRGRAEILVGAGVVAFAVANLWDFHLYLPGPGIPFFLLAGSWFPLPAGAPSSSRLGLSCALSGLVALVVAALFLSVAGLQRQATLAAFESGRQEAAQRHAGRWAAAAPGDADARALLGELALAAGDRREAARRLQEAADLDPWTPFRRRRLSRLYLRYGDLSGAAVEAAAAAALFPRRETYRLERDRILEALQGEETR